MRLKFLTALTLVIFSSLMLWLVSACSEKPAPAETGAAKVTKVKIALNWKPEPEFGGIYAAKELGIFAKHGLDVEIQPLLDKAKTVVIAGQSEFGVAAADEIVAARSQGAPLVGIFAIYQTNPQGIMTHESKGFQTLEDALKSDGTMAVEPGLHYADFFKKKYSDIRVKLVPYDYSVAKFMLDPNYSQQCFVTSEPIEAKNKGGDPKVFLIADSGYDPYAGVIVTLDSYQSSNPQIVKAMTDALREGWRAYLDEPAKINELMAKLNKDMTLDSFNKAADAQKNLIDTAFTKSNGLGATSLERWETLITQLVDLKVIDKPVDAKACFTGASAAK